MVPKAADEILLQPLILGGQLFFLGCDGPAFAVVATFILWLICRNGFVTALASAHDQLQFANSSRERDKTIATAHSSMATSGLFPASRKPGLDVVGDRGPSDAMKPAQMCPKQRFELERAYVGNFRSCRKVIQLAQAANVGVGEHCRQQSDVGAAGSLLTGRGLD